MKTHMISISEAYHKTVDILKEHWRLFLIISLIPNILTFVMTVSARISFIGWVAQFQSATVVSTQLGVTTLLVIGVIFIQFAQLIALVFAVEHIKASVTAGVAYIQASKYIWKMVFLIIAVGLAILVALLAGYIAVILLSLPVGLISIEAMNSAFVILTIIPTITGILPVFFYILAPYYIIDQNADVRESMRWSYTHVKKHFWKMLLHILLLFVFVSIALAIINRIPRFGYIISLTLSTPLTVIYLHTLYTHLKEASSNSK